MSDRYVYDKIGALVESTMCLAKSVVVVTSRVEAICNYLAEKDPNFEYKVDKDFENIRERNMKYVGLETEDNSEE